MDDDEPPVINIGETNETIIENDYERIVIRHEVKDPNIFAIGCIQYINQINLDRTIAGYLKI